MTRLSRIICLSLLLSGCAAPGRFPSLAQRPAERAYAAGGDAAVPTPAPAAPIPPDAPLQARIAALRADAEAAHGRFAARADEASRAVDAAKGKAPGSDPWAAATVALAALDAARSETAQPLGDLDTILVKTAVAAADGGAAADHDAAVAADAAAGKLLDDEDARIAALRRKVAD